MPKTTKKTTKKNSNKGISEVPETAIFSKLAMVKPREPKAKRSNAVDVSHVTMDKSGIYETLPVNGTICGGGDASKGCGATIAWITPIETVDGVPKRAFRAVPVDLKSVDGKLQGVRHKCDKYSR